MTEQEIEALCKALDLAADIMDHDYTDSASELVRKALTAIRQLQQPWRGMESADVTAERDRYKAALEAIENGTMPRRIA